MENLKRKPRSVTLSEDEITKTEIVMNYYHLHSVSETLRFLAIREFTRITGTNSEVNNGK